MTDVVRVVALALVFVAVAGSPALGGAPATVDANATTDGVSSATTTAEITTTAEPTVTQVNTTYANVTFACDFVRVSVPDGRSYALVVHYVDTASGTRSHASMGALVGTVREPFDDEIVFVEVQVVLDGGVVASAVIPEGCPGAVWA